MTKNLKPRHRLSRFAILLALLLPLTGCAAAVGAGAGIGIAAVSERGIKTRAIDLKTEAYILKEFLKMLSMMKKFVNFILDLNLTYSMSHTRKF